MIACLVTTFNRPSALERSLPQIAALGVPVLVVDDGSRSHEQAYVNEAACDRSNCGYLRLPENRGLAAALNIGLSYWLADKSIDWISYFQDDVDVHPKTLEILAKFHGRAPILTGHDAGEHAAFKSETIDAFPVKWKWNARATHLHAHRDFWAQQMPIPTRELGAPRRTKPGERGLGSNVDWHIAQTGPNSCKKTNRPIMCIPGLVRTFLWKAEDSSWANEQRAGEDPQLAVIL